MLHICIDIIVENVVHNVRLYTAIFMNDMRILIYDILSLIDTFFYIQ